MKIIRFKLKAVFLFLILGSFASVSFAQNSIGINTTNPSQNAALHIVSPGNDQGIIIPSLTTAQRTALSPSAAENGLLVYDKDESTFYYWKLTLWEKLGTGSIPTLILPQNNIFVGNASGEAAAVPVTGVISITNTGATTLSNNVVTPTKLYGISSNGTLNEILTSDGAGGFKWVTPVDNDKQTLSLTETNLAISDGNSIDISSINTDEQELTISGNDLSISGGNSVTLPTFTDTDDQTLSLTGNQLAISDGNSVDLTNVGSDDQTATEVNYDKTNSNLTATTVQDAIDEIDAKVKANTDTDPTNEIQELTLTGTTLGLSKNTTTVNLSSINTDNQELTLTGSELSISGGNSVTLPTFTDTDDQTLSLTGNELAITNGNSINISSINTDKQELSVSGSELTISGGNTVDLATLTGVDTDDQTAAEVNYDNSSSKLTATKVQGAIDELNTKVKADADTDPTNEIQSLALSGSKLSISGGNFVTLPTFTDTDDQNAEEVSYTNSDLTATNVQDAIDELNTDIKAIVANPNFTLAETNIFVGDASNKAQAVPITGDISITNAGVTSISGNVVTPTKLFGISGDGNADDVLTSDGAGGFTWSTTAAENVTYDNTTSGLTATNTQEAIDEIKTSLGSVDTYAVPYWNDTDSKYKNSNLWSNGTGVIVSATAPTVDADFVHAFEVKGAFKTNKIFHSSDERWKKNIVTLDNSLEKVQQLRGVSYEFKTEEYSDQNFDKGTQIGLIAQEIEKIYPELVTTDNNGFKAVEYANVVAILIEAIKEQQILIESQNKEIESLKTSNASMQTQIDTMQGFQNQINALQTQIAAMNSVLLLLQPTANSSK